MSDWWYHRCTQPATYRMGRCDHPLLRVSDDGDVEVKCGSCKRVQVVTRDQLEQYRVRQLVST